MNMKTLLLSLGMIGFFVVLAPAFIFVFTKVMVDRDLRYLGKFDD
jgi:hypothetical protein